MGGASSEREVSLRSGQAVCGAFKRLGLDVHGVDARNGFRKQLSSTKPRMVFIALHGRGGEDGAVQKVLEELDIPYIGSTPRASLQAFDKLKSKKIFDLHNIPTPPWICLTRKNWEANWKKLSPPVFLKPVREGSSIGIILAKTERDYEAGLEVSLKQYSSVLVERKITGREFTVGILGEKALPVLELKTKREFYDYEAKYTKGLTEYFVPASIGEDLSNTLRTLAEKVHKELGLRDFSRVDIMMDSAGRPYVLEANSIPGFTETSLLPKAAKAAGIDFDHLCLELVELASRRLKVGV